MRMMQEMDAAVAEAVEATGRTAGTLRINTLGMSAQKLIAPRLGRFIAPLLTPFSTLLWMTG
jgi:DNA-binding transcriptional LysR family regulator